MIMDFDIFVPVSQCDSASQFVNKNHIHSDTMLPLAPWAGLGFPSGSAGWTARRDLPRPLVPPDRNP